MSRTRRWIDPVATARAVVTGCVLLTGCASAPAGPSGASDRPEAAGATPTPAPPEGLRLPTDVRPTAQRISLRLDPAGSTFTGTVRFQLAVSTATSSFWLHAQDLTIRRASLVQGGVERPVRTAVSPPDLLAVIAGAPLVAGDAELVLEYQGPLDLERSRGLYKVAEGNTPYLYTFLEAVDARRSFPCFDEPGFKIPWELEIAVPPGQGAFANAAERGRQIGGDGWTTIRFERTRPLPSYLVAFAAGPFDVVPGAPAGHQRTPLRFIVPRGRRAELAYAQSILPRIVGLLEDATAVPYPYGKLDVLVVPRFWGTMEHPGLVALGQPLMLFPPGVEALKRQQFGATIAVHELAHYWYGDLVTLAWWDETWLNESFAEWIEKKVTDRLEPGWRWLRQRLREREEALQADALPTAKRIREPVRSRQDIDASFDAALTYSKGSTVLAMFERWLGEGPWREALAGYLRAHADRNVTSAELFASLDGALGRNVSLALATFVDQPHFPLVSGALKCEGQGSAQVQLAQSPFVPGAPDASAAPTWRIPVCARAGRGRHTERVCTLLDGPTGTLSLPATVGCPDWVLLNDGGLGYYRTRYDGALRAKLARAPASALTAEEQVALALDLSALAERGEVRPEEVLDRAVWMTRQADSDVAIRGWELLGGWELFDAPFSDLPRTPPDHWLRNDRLPRESQTRRVELIGRLGTSRARRIGWTPRPGESLNVRELRRVLLATISLDGNDRLLQQTASRLARAWLETGQGVDEDLLAPVLEVAAARGDAALFEAMTRRALTAPDRNDRTRIIDALGRFEDPQLAARARALLDDPRFDLRDTSRLLGIQMAHPETRAQAWPVLRDRAADLAPRMRDDEAKSMISSIAAACDRGLRDEAVRTLAPLAERVDGGPFAFRQALGRIDKCVQLHERTDGATQAWLVRQTRPWSAQR